MMHGPRPVVSNTAAMTPATTQKPLTQQRRAVATAPVTVRTRHLGPISRGSVVVDGHHRDRRQQIIDQRWGGTLMRHSFSSRPIAIHPGSMLLPGTRGLLVALPSRSQGLLARLRGAATVAVDLSPVAAAADDHLTAAASTYEQAARCSLDLPSVADAA
jgi:hypothetical protein